MIASTNKKLRIIENIIEDKTVTKYGIKKQEVRSISLILNLYHSIDRICSDTSNLSKKFLAKHQRSEM